MPRATAKPKWSPSASAALKRPASIAKAAEHYDVSTRTIRRWIASGRLRAYRVGPSLLRVDLDDLDQLARPVLVEPRTA